MKKIVLVCGLIAGLIVSSVMVIVVATGQHNNNGMLIGYASMVMAFSLIFVGVKNYRDHYNGGSISFKKAFTIGLLITLVAATCYVITWLVDYYFFIPDFADKYAAVELEKLKATGATPQQVATQKATLDRFTSMYKNPFFNALITYSEIVPVGLIISLISALVLKRKTVILPVPATV